jgi:hypothetical protein
VVLEDGSYVGRNPVYRLTDLASELEASGVAMTEELLDTLTVQAGENERSFVVGFADVASGRVVTVEGRVLPGELGVLGDAIRPQLVDHGGHLVERRALVDVREHGHLELGSNALQYSQPLLEPQASEARYGAAIGFVERSLEHERHRKLRSDALQPLGRAHDELLALDDARAGNEEQRSF